AVDPEKQHRADDGEDDAPQRETVQPGAGDGVTDEPPDERADDADQHGDDDAPRILTRHEGLGDRPRDQPEHDPSEDTHIRASKGVSRLRLSLSQRAYHVRSSMVGGAWRAGAYAC